MHSVLIICTDATTFESIAQHFPPGGWVAERAGSVTEALGITAADPPDLIVLHPSADNTPETISLLRDAQELSGTPVLALVGTDRTHELDRELPPGLSAARIIPEDADHAVFEQEINRLVGIPMSGSIEDLPPDSISLQPPPSSETAELETGELETELIVMPVDGVSASDVRGSDDADSATSHEDDELEVEVIELATPNGHASEGNPFLSRVIAVDEEPGLQDISAPQYAAPTVDTRALAETPVAGTPMHIAPTRRASDPYTRTLSHALIVWEGDLRKLQTQRDKARDAFVKLRDKALALDTDRDSLEHQLERANGEISRLRVVLEKLRTRGTKAPPDPEREEAPPPDGPSREGPPDNDEVLTLRQEADATRRDLSTLLAQLDERENRLTRRDAELSEAREEAERAWRECDELTVRLGESKEELRAAREAADSGHSEHDLLRQQLAESDRERERALASFAAREAELRSLEEDIDRLREEHTTALAREKSARQEVEIGRENLQALQNELAALEASLETVAAERDEARAHASEATDELRALKKQTESHDDQARALSERVHELTTELRSVREGAQVAEGQVARLKAALDVARAEGETWRGERERLQVELATARAAVDAAKSAVAASDLQFESRAADLSSREPRDGEGDDDLVVLLVDDDAAEASGGGLSGLDTAGSELEEALRAADDALARAGHRPSGTLATGDEGTAPGTSLQTLQAERDRLVADKKRLEQRERALLQSLATAKAEITEAKQAGVRLSAAAAETAREQEFEQQRAQLRLLQMDLDIARQQLKLLGVLNPDDAARVATQLDRAAGEVLGGRRGELDEALALTKERLHDLDIAREEGVHRQKGWQAVLTQIGLQMARLLKASTIGPALRESNVDPEKLYKDLKRLAGESANLFSDRRSLIEHQETALRLLRDRLADTLNSSTQGAPTEKDSTEEEDPTPSDSTN